MIAEFLIFLFLTSFLFLGLGYFFVSRAKFELNLVESFSLSTVFGIALFTISLYISNFLGLNNLTFAVLIIFGFLGLRELYTKFRNSFKFDSILLLIIISGTILTVFITFMSGITTKSGIKFYGANTDGVWHIAIINSILKSFPPQNPIFAGTQLKNYHILIDTLIAESGRFTNINVLNLYFRFFPILISLLLGLNVFVFVERLFKNKQAAYIAVFLSYFAGSFGYIAVLSGKIISPWESLFWSSQSVSLLVNLQLAFSFVLFLAGLSLINLYERSPNPKALFITSIVLGSIIGFKVYGGLLILAALFIVAIFNIFHKKSFSFLILFGVSFFISLLITPVRGSLSSFLIYEPGWFIKTMMEAADHLNNVDWELRRQTYIAQNNLKRVVQLWIEGGVVFLIGNMGVRTLGILYLKRRIKDYLNESVAIKVALVVTGASITIPFIFIQRGVVWNSIQFFYYSLLVLNIFTGIVIAKFSVNRKIKFLLITAVVLLSLPTTYDTLKNYSNYYSEDIALTVTKDELEAFEYIKKQNNNSPILTFPTDVPYVSAITGHAVFFDAETLNQLTLTNYEERKKAIKSFYCNEVSQNETSNFLSKNNIKYILVRKKDSCIPKLSLLDGAKLIYQSSTIDLFEYKPDHQFN